MAKYIGDWFSEEVFRWRTGASIAWSIILVYPTVILYILLVNINIYPLHWVFDCFWTLLSLRTWFYTLLLVAVVGITALWNQKYSVSPKIYRQRWMFYYNTPRDAPLSLTYYCSGGLAVWCLLNIVSGITGSLTYIKEDKRYLNEAHLFLVLHGVYVAIIYCRQVKLNGNYLQFPVIQEAKFFQVKSKVAKLLWQSVCNVTRTLKYYYVLYFIFGHSPTAWLVHNLGVERSATKIDTVYGMLDPGLAWKAILTGTVIHFMWNMANFLFKVYNTEAVEFPIESVFEEDSYKTLSNALSCSRVPLVQYLGYQDLLLLSKHSPSRRKTVFSLSQPGGHPHNWRAISTQCIQAINLLAQEITDFNNATMGAMTGDKTSFVRGDTQTGNETTIGSPWTSPDQHNSTLYLDSHNSSSFNQSSYTRRSIHSVGNGNATHLHDTRGTSQTPEITQTSMKDKAISYLKSRPIISYFTEDLADSKSQQLFSNSQIHIWAVEAMSLLVVASYNEDRFGVVQKSLADILGCLLNLHEAMEKHSKLATSMSRQTSFPLRLALRSVNKSALYRIANLFGNYIKEVPLSSEHARRMKTFTEHKE